MKIKFTQSRILLDGSKVESGEELDLPEAEAKAFIANNVAVAVKAGKEKEKEE